MSTLHDQKGSIFKGKILRNAVLRVGLVAELERPEVIWARSFMAPPPGSSVRSIGPEKNARDSETAAAAIWMKKSRYTTGSELMAGGVNRRRCQS